MAKKDESQIKAHVLGPSDLSPITEFLAVFKLACNSNNVHEEAAMLELLFFAKNAFAKTFTSCGFVAVHIATDVVSFNNSELPMQKKLLQSSSKAVIYPLEKFSDDKTIAEMDFKILLKTDLYLMQYSNDLYMKFCKVAGG